MINIKVKEYIDKRPHLKNMRIAEVESYISNFISPYDLMEFYGKFDEEDEQMIFCFESRLLNDWIKVNCKTENRIQQLKDRMFL
jgi:hypothetical protein